MFRFPAGSGGVFERRFTLRCSRNSRHCASGMTAACAGREGGEIWARRRALAAPFPSARLCPVSAEQVGVAWEIEPSAHTASKSPFSPCSPAGAETAPRRLFAQFERRAPPAPPSPPTPQPGPRPTLRLACKTMPASTADCPDHARLASLERKLATHARLVARLRACADPVSALAEFDAAMPSGADADAVAVADSTTAAPPPPAQGRTADEGQQPCRPQSVPQSASRRRRCALRSDMLSDSSGVTSDKISQDGSTEGEEDCDVVVQGPADDLFGRARSAGPPDSSSKITSWSCAQEAASGTEVALNALKFCSSAGLGGGLGEMGAANFGEPLEKEDVGDVSSDSSTGRCGDELMYGSHAGNNCATVDALDALMREESPADADSAAHIDEAVDTGSLPLSSAVATIVASHGCMLDSDREGLTLVRHHPSDGDVTVHVDPSLGENSDAPPAPPSPVLMHAGDVPVTGRSLPLAHVASPGLVVAAAGAAPDKVEAATCAALKVGSKSLKKERVTVLAKCTEPKAGQTRYWTQAEHDRFLEAVAVHGEKAYVAISNYVETRTPKQVRTHAQKFTMKVARLARLGNSPPGGAPPPHTRGSGKAAKSKAAKAAAAAAAASATAAAATAAASASAPAAVVDAAGPVVSDACTNVSQAGAPASAEQVPSAVVQDVKPEAALPPTPSLAPVQGRSLALLPPELRSAQRPAVPPPPSGPPEAVEVDGDAYMRYIDGGGRDLEDLEDVAVLATSPFADGGEEWLGI
jgi:SHAQKYF class myb-like DNA-binding protein